MLHASFFLAPPPFRFLTSALLLLPLLLSPLLFFLPTEFPLLLFLPTLFGVDAFLLERFRCPVDTSEAGEQVEVIELLVQHGARWVPKDRGEINSARRSLLKLVPRYTLAFFSIMATNKACSRGVIQALLAAPTMKKHLGERTQLVTKFLSSFPEDHQPGST